MWSSISRKILWDVTAGGSSRIHQHPPTCLSSLLPSLLSGSLQSSPLPWPWTLSVSPAYCMPSPPTAHFRPLRSPHHPTPWPSLHVLDIASSHSTHRDGEHGQEEDPAVVEGHLEEVLGTGATEPQGGQQEEQQQAEQQQHCPCPWPQLHSGHLQGRGEGQWA